MKSKKIKKKIIQDISFVMDKIINMVNVHLFIENSVDNIGQIVIIRRNNASLLKQLDEYINLFLSFYYDYQYFSKSQEHMFIRLGLFKIRTFESLDDVFPFLTHMSCIKNINIWGNFLCEISIQMSFLFIIH